jgi:hypothetical protein
MAFSIDEFKSNATQYGFTRPSFFLLAIPAAPAWYGKSTRYLTFLCSGAALPGSQIITSDERVSGYGKTRKVPYDVGHTDVNLTFYADGNGNALAFFEGWLRNIVAYGADDINIKGALRGEVHYPNHYETQIEIYQYNENPGTGNIEILKYTLNRAFPVSIGEQALSWDQGDAISTLSVTVAFKDYWVEKNEAGKFGARLAMARSNSYLADLQRGGYESEYQERKNRGDNAEGITTGVLGLDKLTAALGVISKYSSMINDKLNVVNNISAEVNSALGSYGSLLKTKVPSIPSIPNIRFP